MRVFPDYNKHCYRHDCDTCYCGELATKCGFEQCIITVKKYPSFLRVSPSIALYKKFLEGKIDEQKIIASVLADDYSKLSQNEKIFFYINTINCLILF